MDRIEWNGHVWELRALSDDAGKEVFSLLCLDPDVDASEIDQTQWPSDALVSEWADCAVKFADGGDHPEHPEGIYRAA